MNSSKVVNNGKEYRKVHKKWVKAVNLRKKHENGENLNDEELAAMAKEKWYMTLMRKMQGMEECTASDMELGPKRKEAMGPKRKEAKGPKRKLSKTQEKKLMKKKKLRLEKDKRATRMKMREVHDELQKERNKLMQSERKVAREKRRSAYEDKKIFMRHKDAWDNELHFHPDLKDYLAHEFKESNVLSDNIQNDGSRELSETYNKLATNDKTTRLDRIKYEYYIELINMKHVQNMYINHMFDLYKGNGCCEGNGCGCSE